MSLFTYRGKLTKVIDGDTLDLRVDLGFHIEREIRVRLSGVDTAEIYGVKKSTDEYQRGIKHKQFTANWIGSVSQYSDKEWPLFVKTFKDTTGKYGRYTAVIGDWKTDETLNNALKDEFDL